MTSSRHHQGFSSSKYFVHSVVQCLDNVPKVGCWLARRFINHKKALHHLQMSNAGLLFDWPGEALPHLQMSNSGLPFVWPGEVLPHLQMSNAGLLFAWPGETLPHLQMPNSGLLFVWPGEAPWGSHQEAKAGASQPAGNQQQIRGKGWSWL